MRLLLHRLRRRLPASAQAEHQRWKFYGVMGVGAMMVAAVTLVYTYEVLDYHYDITGALSGESLEEAAPRERRLFYPYDALIGKWDIVDGKRVETKDVDKGKYGNAPAGRKILIVVHMIIILYMLIGLNTVCDIYFCGALDQMVEKWQVKPDVAGATFMAAGGSAPELFTSLIGAVITENDVGFGTIVGSAVFNVLAVIGCCGMAASTPIQLTWWPLARDCTCYIIGLAVLAWFASGKVLDEVGKDGKTTGKKIGGGQIELWESIVLFCLYLCYCILMYFNEKIEASVKGAVSSGLAKVEPIANETTAEVVGKEEKPTDERALREAADEANTAPDTSGVSGKLEAQKSKDGAKHHDHHMDHHLRRVHHKAHVAHHHHHTGDGQPSVVKNTTSTMSKDAYRDTADSGVEEAAKQGEKSEPEADAQSDESDEDDILALVTKPEGTVDQICWYLSLPVYFPMWLLTPNPEKLFLGTFVVALIWIAFFSFWLVYCVELFTEAILGGGNNVVIVMSFTLLAAGTSIPDLVSSMAVAKAGEGDMAVSSSIGSNIFDILVGLPVPWIIKIGVVEMGVNGKSEFRVPIKSPYISLYVFLLLFMVFMVILSIHFLKWKLNKTLGYAMGGLYVLFLCIVLPVELVNKGPYI